MQNKLLAITIHKLVISQQWIIVENKLVISQQWIIVENSLSLEF